MFSSSLVLVFVLELIYKNSTSIASSSSTEVLNNTRLRAALLMRQYLASKNDINFEIILYLFSLQKVLFLLRLV